MGLFVHVEVRARWVRWRPKSWSLVHFLLVLGRVGKVPFGVKNGFGRRFLFSGVRGGGGILFLFETRIRFVGPRWAKEKGKGPRKQGTFKGKSIFNVAGMRGGAFGGRLPDGAPPMRVRQAEM